MAAESYYYFFSLIAVIGVMLYIANLLSLRLKGKTTFGLQFKPGTIAYERVIRFANNRNLIRASILGVIFIAGLFNSTARLIYLDTPDSRFILVFAPISTALGYLGMIYWVSKQIRDHKFI